MGAIDRLSEAIAYPAAERKHGASTVELLVDGNVVQVTEARGKLRLSRNLGAARDAEFAQLAGYAAGRMLKDRAVLAWDPRARGLMLWQEVPASGSTEELLEEFDLFLDSCDWWEARMKELINTGGKPLREMVILP